MNTIENNYVAVDDNGKCFWIILFRNIKYNGLNRCMVSWFGIDSYFNKEKIKICDIEIMTAAYGSSGPFGSK